MTVLQTMLTAEAIGRPLLLWFVALLRQRFIDPIGHYHALGDLLSDGTFLNNNIGGFGRNLCGVLPGHDDNAIAITNHDITGVDRQAAASNG